MNRSVLLLSAMAIASAFTTAPLFADEAKPPLGVVELFTSQGCSSCPPADDVLADLARSGNAIALGYHVNYWDYLGWKDTFGSTENTARQNDYGKSFGIRSVYTPQAVINGRTHVNGADRGAVSGALKNMARSGKGLNIGINVTRSGESVMIDTQGARNGVGNAHLVLVYFDPVREIVIERGENKGRTIDYVNPVTDFQTVGIWHGKPARFEFPMSEIDRSSRA